MLSLFLSIIVLSCTCVNCSFCSFDSKNTYASAPIQNQVLPCPPPSSQNQEPNNAVDLQTLTQGLGLPPNIPQNLVPVALNSEVAVPTTFAPLRISVRKNAQLLCRNDGFLVYSVPVNQNEVVATLTGGPADSEYLFCLLAQNEDGVTTNTRASTTENGVGFPAQVQMFFRKKAYGSFKNALRFPDGIIIIPFNILPEGSVPNQLFEPYRNLLNRLIQPNSTSSIRAYDAFEWLLSSLEPGYYTHASSYIDLYSGREYPCATNIQPNFAKHPFTSFGQFKAFTNLLNRNYQPEYNPLPLYPLAFRQVLQAISSVCHDYYD